MSWFSSFIANIYIIYRIYSLLFDKSLGFLGFLIGLGFRFLYGFISINSNMLKNKERK